MQLLATTVAPESAAWNQWILDHLAVEHPFGILAVLLAVLAALFWFGQKAGGKRLFGIVPMLVFCYFVPTTLTTFGILPEESALYSWVKSYLLPCSLLLLIIALDVPGILRLGPRAVIMLLAGTTGVVIGGPVALLVGQSFLTTAEPVPYVAPDDTTSMVEAEPERDLWSLPDEAWRGLTALAGSWIGGGANFVALGDIAYEELPEPIDASGNVVSMNEDELARYREKQQADMLGLMVIVDVGVANIWMGILLFSAGHQRRIDAWTGADTTAIDDLRQRLIDFQERVTRVPSLPDIMMILALGFMGAWVSYKGGLWLADVLVLTDADATAAARAIDPNAEAVTNPILGATTWKFILVTTIGIGLSYTRARDLEGAGASKIGAAMLYLLIACIGASASFTKVAEAPGLIIVGAMWMLIHVTVMLGLGFLIKAPIFFVAVGSQANIGGAASAPVVASAFHPALAPVGALLAVAGYVLGTYAGIACMLMMKWAAG